MVEGDNLGWCVVRAKFRQVLFSRAYKDYSVYQDVLGVS